MTIITKNPIKIVLIIVLLLLTYNLYNNKQGNVISYGLIVIGLYLIYNDSFLENMVDTNYENNDIEKLLNLDINSLFNTSNEPLSKEEIEEKINDEINGTIEEKIDDKNLEMEVKDSSTMDKPKEELEKKLKQIEENLELTDKEKEQAKKEAEAEFKAILQEEKDKLKEKYMKAIVETKDKLVDEAVKTQNKRLKEKENIKKLNNQLSSLKIERKELNKTKELSLDEQRELAKKLFGQVDVNESNLEEKVRKLEETKENKMRDTGLIAQVEETPCDSSIAKAIAPLQAEIAKLREKTAIPPDVKKAKVKNFTLLAETLIEKGALSEEEYENMKTKLDSNVLTLNDAISALEKLKRASKSIKKNVPGKKDKWWSDMSKSELPMEMYIPKGEQIDNKWSNEFSILNTDKWTVPMARPPVCIDSSPKDIMPVGTSGYPMNLKYYDSARYVSTSAKMEKAKKDLESKSESDSKEEIELKEDIKEKFTNWI